MGQAYNVSCQVSSIFTLDLINVCHILYCTILLPPGTRVQASRPNLALRGHQPAERGQLQGKSLLSIRQAGLVKTVKQEQEKIPHNSHMFTTTYYNNTYASS